MNEEDEIVMNGEPMSDSEVGMGIFIFIFILVVFFSLVDFFGYHNKGTSKLQHICGYSANYTTNGWQDCKEYSLLLEDVNNRYDLNFFDSELKRKDFASLLKEGMMTTPFNIKIKQKVTNGELDKNHLKIISKQSFTFPFKSKDSDTRQSRSFLFMDESSFDISEIGGVYEKKEIWNGNEYEKKKVKYNLVSDLKYSMWNNGFYKIKIKDNVAYVEYNEEDIVRLEGEADRHLIFDKPFFNYKRFNLFKLLTKGATEQLKNVCEHDSWYMNNGWQECKKFNTNIVVPYSILNKKYSNNFDSKEDVTNFIRDIEDIVVDLKQKNNNKLRIIIEKTFTYIGSNENENDFDIKLADLKPEILTDKIIKKIDIKKNEKERLEKRLNKKINNSKIKVNGSEGSLNIELDFEL